MPEYPSPSGLDHNFFGPSADHEFASPLTSTTKFRVGPPNCGHSGRLAPDASPANKSAANGNDISDGRTGSKMVSHILCGTIRGFTILRNAIRFARSCGCPVPGSHGAV